MRPKLWKLASIMPAYSKATVPNMMRSSSLQRKQQTGAGRMGCLFHSIFDLYRWSTAEREEVLTFLGSSQNWTAKEKLHGKSIRRSTTLIHFLCETSISAAFST